jgi:anti-anti-sigma factor
MAWSNIIGGKVIVMIKVEEHEDRVKFVLAEEFNFRSHKEFRELYMHRSPDTCYEIDFRHVTHFDSAALGILLLLRSHCGDINERVHLVNCGEKVRKLLDGVCFARYFRIS